MPVSGPEPTPNLDTTMETQQQNETAKRRGDGSDSTGLVMSKAQQIQWLVDWYLEQPRYRHPGLCATDFELECEFCEACGVELSYSTWRSRIRDAADRLGLQGWRAYTFDGDTDLLFLSSRWCTHNRRNNMLTNEQIHEYESLLQREEDGEALTLYEQGRLYELEQRASVGAEETNHE